MLRIKGHRGTCQTFIFIKHETYKLKSCFRDKGHPYTFYLPNLNPNRFKYYATHQGASRDKLTLHIYQPFNHICYNLIFATRVIPVLSFYGIQNQIGSHIIFHIKGQVQTSHLSNLQAYRPKSHFHNKDQSNTFILPNTKPNRFTQHVCNKVHQGTSSNF